MFCGRGLGSQGREEAEESGFHDLGAGFRTLHLLDWTLHGIMLLMHCWGYALKVSENNKNGSGLLQECSGSEQEVSGSDEEGSGTEVESSGSEQEGSGGTIVIR